ncbi:MAG: hypothetical protein HC894_23155 [Microcoleus sp. SM1_3_4]|nr:hypothetical protein [Microcoleus sp. SM1_3_4]
MNYWLSILNSQLSTLNRSRAGTLALQTDRERGRSHYKPIASGDARTTTLNCLSHKSQFKPLN